ARTFAASMQGYADISKRITLPIKSVPIGSVNRQRANLKQSTLNADRIEDHPEDFNPLGNECFQNPYEFYRLLRDEYPVYQLKNGVFCVSRYHDIAALSRDTDTYSSQHQGVVANLKPNQDLLKEVAKFEKLSRLGVIPADVLATSDPPVHTQERKVGHASLGARYVKSLEPEVEALCESMLFPLLEKGQMEFMQSFGWRLPMILIMRLLGLPEQDFEQIKLWCVEILNSQNGIQRSGELAASYAAALTFLRYCWQHFLKAKRNPKDNLIGLFVRNVLDSNTDFNDQKAVSAIFQLIIAGSDSSATTMGNALKMMIENPNVQSQLREDPALIPAFVEEVFRLESAFQGHFRWAKHDTVLHGQSLPKGSRIFLMWASGNRDERFWEQPDQLLLNRKNGKKHLTFGHGVHACLGRELARMEIKIVLKAFLDNTRTLRINGETPYVASMFARTLLTLPIAFESR
ncbi:MAG: cytochrome P450, partial [Pseudomonadales bacterium]|nr:cytochrome P450 [Pseudomonadales bacterium]